MFATVAGGLVRRVAVAARGTLRLIPFTGSVAGDSGSAAASGLVILTRCSSHQVVSNAAPISAVSYDPTIPGAQPSAAVSETSTLKFQVQQDAAELGRREGPLALYERLIADGELQTDLSQRRVLEYLNAVYHGAPSRNVRGLYLYGGVGCGKTMAMDLFYSSLCEHAELRVRRQHFHDFLHGVQLELHRLQQSGREGATRHIVEQVGENIAANVDVLCFDEFAITTIQDCCLLMPLFSSLFKRGVLVVATSNRAPENLYEDGLNRHVYLNPFLKVLLTHCKVHHVESETDYRTVHFENSPDAGVYCWPPDRCFIDRWFQVVAGHTGTRGCVDVSYGRSLDVPLLSDCGRVARFDFADLCRSHLAADDYNQIARQFHTLLIDDVPRLTVDDHNEARRFTLLIDCCYEHHVRLICSMDGSPEQLLGGLSMLRDMNLSTVGSGGVGCGDGDSSPSSSGVLQAIQRIKTSIQERNSEASAKSSGSVMPSSPLAPLSPADGVAEVLSSELQRIRSHGVDDVAIWRQAPGSTPQVSKSWDDRRRISNFTWESSDPTSEQQSIKGVFAAAVASLKESGFAVDRAISRLKEMQTEAFQKNHRLKHSLS